MSQPCGADAAPRRFEIVFQGACPVCGGQFIAYPSRWYVGRWAVDCQAEPGHPTGIGFVAIPGHPRALAAVSRTGGAK